jgi:hypothetical protein
LAAQGELLPLYYYATQEQSRMHTEVASHCLRALGELPAEAVPPLVACYADCTNSVLLVGLIDLLLQQPKLAISQKTLARLVDSVKDADLYRYLVTVLLAAGNAELRLLVLNAARGILDKTRVAILIEVMSDLLSGAGEMDDVATALAGLRANRSPVTRR